MPGCFWPDSSDRRERRFNQFLLASATLSGFRGGEDKNHRTIGYIVTHSDGKQHVEDVSGHTLGYYDPKQDKTEDRNHRTVGYGNLLATLLK